MRNTIKRKLGATEFVEIPDTSSGVSQATIFSLVDEKWSEIFETLQNFDDCQDDWDGMGSPAPEPEILHAANLLARKLRDSEHPAPDRVLVTVDGTICFETGPFPIRTVEVVSGTEAEVWEGGDQLGTYELAD